MNYTVRTIAWLVVLSCLYVFNCSRDYPLFEKPDGRFPLGVGNEWRLRRELKMEFYNGHPPGFENPWIQKYSIHWQIVDRDILEGYKSYVLKNEWYEEREGRDSSLHWYIDYWKGSYGLYNIGYTHGGGPPPELPQTYKLKFAGEEFSSWEEIFDWMSGGQLMKEDTILRIPPEIILEYPLEIGKEWIAFEGLFGLVKKKVVDRETLTTKTGTFSCYKVEVTLEFTTQLFLPDPMVWYDWFSDEGLVKKYIWSTGEWTDPYGNPVGTFEITDVYLLESYSIRQ